jgi:IS5 family transposase
LLAESLRVAHEAGALRNQDLKWVTVTVDTTVQLKAITFPTDAKLLHAPSRGSTVWRASCGSPIFALPRPRQ